MTKFERLMTKLARKESRDRSLNLRRYLRGFRQRSGDRTWRILKVYYADASGGGRRGGNWRTILINKRGDRRRLWYAYFRYWRKS